MSMTFGGQHLTHKYGAPTIRDIAVQSMRIARFAGAGQIFYPIGIHSMLVADLLPARLEVYGLLHDACEVVQGADVCQPFKTREQRAVESSITDRIHLFFDLPKLTPEDHALIKVADTQAVGAEGCSACAPRGFPETQENHIIDARAVERLNYYLENYDPAATLSADGVWAVMFERRLRRAIRELHREKT